MLTSHKARDGDVESLYDYFGARYYDARIGRWLAVDPLAEKYPYLSGYCYVANMPLLSIDPDGKRIVISGSQSFQQRSLVALQRMSNEKLVLRNGTVYIRSLGTQNGTRDFPFGTTLIRDLNSKGPDSKTVTIVETNGGDCAPVKSYQDAMTPGKCTNSEIQWNPQNREGGGKRSWKDRPSFIGLGHELIHGRDAAKGTVDSDHSGATDPDNKGAILLPHYEVKARKEENQLRKEQGTPLRREPRN